MAVCAHVEGTSLVIDDPQASDVSTCALVLISGSDYPKLQPLVPPISGDVGLTLSFAVIGAWASFMVIGLLGRASDAVDEASE